MRTSSSENAGRGRAHATDDQLAVGDRCGVGEEWERAHAVKGTRRGTGWAERGWSKCPHGDPFSGTGRRMSLPRRLGADIPTTQRDRSAP